MWKSRKPALANSFRLQFSKSVNSELNLITIHQNAIIKMGFVHRSEAHASIIRDCAFFFCGIIEVI